MASSEDGCIDYCTNDYDNIVQNKLDAPMPWIGMYIAAASAACSLAMGADVINGFRSKKLWFPSKYFSLNAFSLTILTVAMKLSVDLTSLMPGINDKLARLSSLILMSTTMANFMVSLGSMENNEIMLNLAALCIFVITIEGNVCIRLFQMRHYNASKLIMGERIECTVFLFLLLVILCSSAVLVPTAKRCIESQYNQMHKRISNERVNHIRKFTIDELRVTVRRCWIMSESGSLQFVIARSVLCVSAGVMCLLLALALLVAHIRRPFMYRGLSNKTSSYKWSTNWILLIQSIGVALGTIAPLLRWFTAAQFRSTMIGKRCLKDEFKVESYWTQSLEHWRDSPLTLKSRHHKLRKFLHDGKRLLLNLCIGVQILIVLSSKLLLVISAKIAALMFCFCHIKSLKESDDKRGLDSSSYVLLLEGEEELPKWTLRNICNEVDELIRIGKKKQSKNLIKLLQKSVNFNGVIEFDNIEIRRLHPQLEPPNCWSLPVVTLTIIAISLPNITHHKSDELLIAVSQGIYFAKLLDETLDSKGELESIRNTADVAWLGVELYREWPGKDLQGAGRTHKETLQRLSDIAEKTVTNFTTGTDNVMVRDPLNWPVKVIAANSMYRITQTILLAHDNNHPQTDEELFERLSVMISDILTACLTNLARVIMLKCHSNAIKEREKSIRQAAVLLGESEEILEILQLREVPNLDPERAASLEGWRSFIEQDNENLVASASATFPHTHAVHVAIELECYLRERL